MTESPTLPGAVPVETHSASLLCPAVVPNVGIIQDVPDAEYHAWDCASQSRTTKLTRGWPPAKLRAYMDDADQDDTDTTAIGTGLHLRMFQPDKFASSICPGPINPKTGKMFGRDSQAFLAWRQDNPDKTVLDDDDLAAIEGMRKSLLTLPDFVTILEHPQTMHEVSFRTVWEIADDTEFIPLQTKGRADLCLPEINLIGDLKTTDDASRDAFERSIYKWGYHHQGAWYRQQSADLGIPCWDFCFFVVERKYPYLPAAYRLLDVVMDRGWHELQRPLITLARAYATGEWPGYPKEIQDVGLPKWAIAT